MPRESLFILSILLHMAGAIFALVVLGIMFGLLATAVGVVIVTAVWTISLRRYNQTEDQRASDERIRQAKDPDAFSDPRMPE